MREEPIQELTIFSFMTFKCAFTHAGIPSDILILALMILIQFDSIYRKCFWLLMWYSSQVLPLRELR